MSTVKVLLRSMKCNTGILNFILDVLKYNRPIKCIIKIVKLNPRLIKILTLRRASDPFRTVVLVL